MARSCIWSHTGDRAAWEVHHEPNPSAAGQTNFELGEALAVLERPPAVLRTLLADLPEGWTTGTEGAGTWSPFDVVGHLIDGEEADWIPRMRIILAQGSHPRFESFDRTRHLARNSGETLSTLLGRFTTLRAENLVTLLSFGVTEEQLSWTAEHPELGRVTLRQHLATWVAHDLDHIVQIGRTMAKQYREAVGPWHNFIRVVRDEDLDSGHTGASVE